MSRQAPARGFLADYRSVNERIQEFYKTYPEGRIVTNIVESITDLNSGTFCVRAELFRAHDDAQPFATGIAIETPTSGQVNKQGFALENAETSSIGRALQNAGIATKASDIRPEEMARIERVSDQQQAAKPAPVASSTPPPVKRFGAGYQVKDGNVTHNVMPAGDHYTCTCREYKEANDPAFMCGHKKAVKEYGALDNQAQREQAK